MSGHESFPNAGELPPSSIGVVLGESKAIIHEPERVLSAEPQQYFEVLMDEKDFNSPTIHSAVIGHRIVDSNDGIKSADARVSAWEGVIYVNPEVIWGPLDIGYGNKLYESLRLEAVIRALERPGVNSPPDIGCWLHPRHKNLTVLSVDGPDTGYGHEFAVIVDDRGKVSVTNSFERDVNGERINNFAEPYTPYGKVGRMNSFGDFAMRPYLSEGSSNAEIAKAFLKAFMYVVDYVKGLEDCPVGLNDDLKRILKWQPQPVDIARTYILSPQAPQAPSSADVQPERATTTTKGFLDRVNDAKQVFDLEAEVRAIAKADEAERQRVEEQQREADEQKRQLFRAEVLRLIRQRAAEILPKLVQSARPDAVFPDTPEQEAAVGAVWYLGGFVLGSYTDHSSWDFEMSSFNTDVRGIVLDSRGRFLVFDKRIETDRSGFKGIAMSRFVSSAHPKAMATDKMLLSVATGSIKEPGLESYLPSPKESLILQDWEERLINLLDSGYDRDEGGDDSGWPVRDPTSYNGPSMFYNSYKYEPPA